MKSFRSFVKKLLPAKPAFLPILGGPFRGGLIFASPRVSLRKVFGAYEAELNCWLRQTLPQVDLVMDVGANDGYFNFGCAAVMRRQGRSVKVVAFEPNPTHLGQLHASRVRAGYTEDEVIIIPKCVGRIDDNEHVTLDSYTSLRSAYKSPLVKIDVEGAELDVLEGAVKWLMPGTNMLIEVHPSNTLMKFRGG
jgi:hypothetical protein